jgi:phenylalanyl-tRNA synthetase beta chain
MTDQCHNGLDSEGGSGMPTVKFEHDVLKIIQLGGDVTHDPKLWNDHLSQIGCVVEECNEESVEIEVFPDRPDLLSAETMAYAARTFLHGKAAQPELPVTSGSITMAVDPSLENVRPIIYGAVVRGVDQGHTAEARDNFIQGLMDHQEKLHFALGRGRKRSSIGVHDLSRLKPPFRVITVDSKYKFTPLAMVEKMSIEEILTSHPKGVDYAHLLDGFDRFPVILDASEDVISFPPIINGAHTTVTENTTDFFIDVTGWDQRSCESSLLLVCLSLALHGGTVESIELTDWQGNTTTCPNGSAQTHSLPQVLLEDVLGRQFSDSEVAEAINRMGGKLLRRRVITDGPRTRERWADGAAGSDEYLIEMPRWRADILHPIDLVEEVATGIGFEDLGVATSTQSIAGKPLTKMTLNRRIRECMQGCGMQQIQSLTLSNESDQFTKMRNATKGDVTQLHNPITTEHTIMRQYLLPSLLRLLAANRHHELPQRVYEMGTVVHDHHNRDRVAWACAEVGTGFTGAKGIAEALLRDLGAVSENLDVTYRATKDGRGPWLTGRGAEVRISGELVGTIGEIDPAVADLFELRVPIQAGEFNVEKLNKLISDPVH